MEGEWSMILGNVGGATLVMNGKYPRVGKIIDAKTQAATIEAECLHWNGVTKTAFCKVQSIRYVYVPSDTDPLPYRLWQRVRHSPCLTFCAAAFIIVAILHALYAAGVLDRPAISISFGTVEQTD